MTLLSTTRMVRTSGWIKSVISGRLTRNLGWFGLAEVFVRLSRLATAIIVARLLMPEHFGIAAVVITTYELLRIIANNGTALMIVRADTAHLEQTCVTAWRISTAVARSLVGVQIIVGAILAAVMARADVFAMLAALSLAYLALPMTDVRYCRILRSNDLKTIAGINAAQVLADNLLTAALALAGFGAWAVVLPKVLTVPVYVVLLKRAEPWQPEQELPSLPFGDVLAFALPVLATDGLATLRAHADKVLVGSLLGIEALGIYTFALNAGLGLTVSLTGALSTSLYPHFAELAHDRPAMLARFDQALRTSVVVVSVIVVAQALAAPYYVPLVFGPRWAFAAPLVAMLCCAGVARPLFDAGSQLLRARGETRYELAGATLFTLVLLGAFAIGLSHGLSAAIAVFAVGSIVGHVAFAVAVRFYAGRQVSPSNGVAVA